MVTYLLNNWAEVAGIAAALHILALAIVNATPTPKDDHLYGKIYKIIEILAGIVTKMAKK